MNIIETGVATSNNKEVVLAERNGKFGEEYIIIIDKANPTFTLSKEIYTLEKALEKFDEVFLQVYNNHIFG